MRTYCTIVLDDTTTHRLDSHFICGQTIGFLHLQDPTPGRASVIEGNATQLRALADALTRLADCPPDDWFADEHDDEHVDQPEPDYEALAAEQDR